MILLDDFHFLYIISRLKPSNEISLPYLMANTKKTSIEESLWNTANKLRGKVESSEYKHVVLGLIFLKFTSDKLERRRQELIDEGKEKYMEMKGFYNMQNNFFLSEEAR